MYALICDANDTWTGTASMCTLYFCNGYEPWNSSYIISEAIFNLLDMMLSFIKKPLSDHLHNLQTITMGVTQRPSSWTVTVNKYNHFSQCKN